MGKLYVNGEIYGLLFTHHQDLFLCAFDIEDEFGNRIAKMFKVDRKYCSVTEIYTVIQEITHYYTIHTI